MALGQVFIFLLILRFFLSASSHQCSHKFSQAKERINVWNIIIKFTLASHYSISMSELPPWLKFYKQRSRNEVAKQCKNRSLISGVHLVKRVIILSWLEALSPWLQSGRSLAFRSDILAPFSRRSLWRRRNYLSETLVRLTWPRVLITEINMKGISE